MGFCFARASGRQSVSHVEVLQNTEPTDKKKIVTQMASVFQFQHDLAF